MKVGEHIEMSAIDYLDMLISNEIIDRDIRIRYDEELLYIICDILKNENIYYDLMRLSLD